MSHQHFTSIEGQEKDSHEHSCGCGCGHKHHQVPLTAEEQKLSDGELNILMGLYERQYLPVARFVMTNSHEENLNNTALAPVYMSCAEETIETVKEWGARFLSLEKKGFITLDYDMPLNDYAYEEYKNSDLYSYFVKSVKEGSQKEGFLFDTPCLELGSMSITEEGITLIKAMLD